LCWNYGRTNLSEHGMSVEQFRRRLFNELNTDIGVIDIYRLKM
jgi:hypothetical protein